MSIPSPTEYQGQRILTTAQLAHAYGVEPQIIVNNFNRNKEDHYTSGKHYHALTGAAKQAFVGNLNQFDLGSKQSKILYLWTEKGALLHAKSLDSVSLQIFRLAGLVYWR